MKRKFLSVFTIAFSMTALMAQEKKTTTDFNQWSIDLNAGASKPAEPFSEGYYSNNLNINHVDLGVRYMLNTKFGFKADFGFDNMKEGSNSLDFNTKYFRTDLQGVVSLGRICNFETWTKVFGLQGHTGVGYSWMTSKNFTGQDNMLNFIIGLTGQIKLSNRFSLNADFSRISNIRQNNNFNGGSVVNSDRTFDGVLYNATVGLSYYLGNKKVHADWLVDSNESNANNELVSQFNELESKVNNSETKLNEVVNKLKDGDNDGVANYLDVEPNSKPGVTVDSKGRSIENNHYRETGGIKKSDEKDTLETSENKSTLDLINGGNVNVYFNSDSAKPTKKSYSNIDLVAKYLKANQSAKAKINGYSDKIGNVKYNEILSRKRADEVKNILVKSGIKSNRLSAHGKGIDSKANEAEKMRHVSFQIK